MENLLTKKEEKMERKLIVIMLALTMILGFSNISMGRMCGGSYFIDEDGDGICDNSDRGGRYGYCAGYVDKDGDGYCDYNGGNRKFFRRGYNGCKGGFPIFNIFDGVPFAYTGEVISVGYGGAGMVIEIENAEVIIYGLGPIWFWDCKNVSRPVAGDVIEVSGYTVDYNDIQRNIAVSITIDGETLELRDPETGAPLWRGSSRWLCQ